MNTLVGSDFNPRSNHSSEVNDKKKWTSLILGAQLSSNW